MGAQETARVTVTPEDRQFESWWAHSGWPLTRRAALYPSADLVKNLCLIAYYQGRMDENTKQGQQLTEQLRKVGE